jgi:hypothetical protein
LADEPAHPALASYMRSAKQGGGMNDDLERLTQDGSVPQEVYRIMRDAIQRTAEQSGRLFQPGQEAHYMALAAAMSLKAAGYSIEKS